MQRSTLIWGSMLIGGVLLMTLLGCLYPYLTKWDKRKATMPHWNDRNRPTIKIKERFSMRLPIVLDSLLVMAAALVLLFGDVFCEMLEQNPWYLNIALLIMFIFGHFLAWAVLLVICSAASIVETFHLKKKYGKTVYIVDETVFAEFDKQ